MRSCIGYTFHFSSDAVRLVMRRLDALAKPAPLRRQHACPSVTHFYDSDDGALLKAGCFAYATRNETGQSHGLSHFRTSSAAQQTWRSWSSAAPMNAGSLAAFAGLLNLPGKIRRVLAQPISLAPRLSIEVQRSSWRLPSFEHHNIEVLLEIGHLDVAGRRIDISELTLSAQNKEAKSALLALALEIHQTTTLLLLPEPAVHKALRILLEPATPLKYEGVKTTGRRLESDFCCATLTAIVEHWLANQVGAREQSDIEYVHQSRVALRRLSAACKLFAPWLDPEWQARLAPELRWLRGLLGQARDWDVFVDTTVPVLCAAIAPGQARGGEFTEAEQFRREAGATLQAALKSTRYATLVLDVVQWLASISRRGALDDRLPGLRKHAEKWLRKNHLNAVSTPHFAQLPEVDQHRIRLRAKQMRYSIEFLAPLLSPKSCKSAIRSYVPVLDALGIANDTVVAARLLLQLTLDAETRGLANDWLAARRQHCIALVEQQLPHLQAPRFA